MSTHNSNLYAYIETVINRYATKTALLDHNNRAWRYCDIDDLSAKFANGLLTAGLQIGDRVSVQVDKSPEALCLYLACLRAGFVFHPLNMAYQSSELAFLLGDAAPAAIVCAAKNKSLMEGFAVGCTTLLTLDANGQGSLMELSSAMLSDYKTVISQQDDLAALLYSSGTTGQPKGIMLSHGNLLGNAQSLIEAWGFTNQDHLLHALPVYHVHGLFIALGCVLLSGASMRWLPAFKAQQVIEYLPSCTVMMGVPTYYTRLLADESFTKDTASNIRVFISGSAPLLDETFTAFEERTGKTILERYGMTETNINTSNPLSGKRKAGSVGLPLPNVEIRVVDENNNMLAQGEIGSVQVKGPNVFKGYWHLPEKTAGAFTPDNFFDTGDKGLIDKDNYLSIVGREKDMVISGGLNIYPKEIELLIDTLPTVLESAVVGVPHADFGEAVLAVIVNNDAMITVREDVVHFLKTQIANFKVPKHVVFVDELPRNVMGKVQKNILRQQFAEILS